MPAAAVIPAPVAYIKVVAVKKLVVEFLSRAALSGQPGRRERLILASKPRHLLVAAEARPLL